MEHLPTQSLGVFGDVSPAHTPAINWYRARGFHIARGHVLANPVSPERGNIVVPEDDSYSFLADRDRIVRYLERNRTAVEENNDALSDARPILDGLPVAKDSAYEVEAQRILAGPTTTCPHIPLSPQPAFLLAWDPDRVLSCSYCQEARVNALVGTPAESGTHCDGCNTHHARITVNAALIGLTCVTLGLCRRCRTTLPDTTSPRPPRKRWSLLRWRGARSNTQPTDHP